MNNQRFLTSQEIFNKAAIHLLTQKKMSMRGTCCAYRGDNDLMCAVGVLIPDQVYKSVKIEGLTIRKLVQQFPDLLPSCGINPISCEDLLADLQYLHDKTPVDCWGDVLSVIATKHSLNTYTIDNLVG